MRRLFRAASRDHDVEIVELFSQRPRFLGRRVRKQDEQIAARGFQFRQNIFQGRLRRGQRELVVVDFGLIFVPEHGGDADPLASGRDDAKRLSEIKEIDVRAGEGAAFSGGHGHERLGRQPQVLGAKADGGVAHRSHRVGGDLVFELRLASEAVGQSADVDGHGRPAVAGQLAEERMPPGDSAQLVLASRAAAGLDVAVLLAGDHDGQSRFRPVLEDLAIGRHRVEWLTILRGRRPIIGLRRALRRHVALVARGWATQQHHEHNWQPRSQVIQHRFHHWRRRAIRGGRVQSSAAVFVIAAVRPLTANDRRDQSVTANATRRSNSPSSAGLVSILTSPMLPVALPR